MLHAKVYQIEIEDATNISNLLFYRSSYLIKPKVEKRSREGAVNVSSIFDYSKKRHVQLDGTEVFYNDSSDEENDENGMDSSGVDSSDTNGGWMQEKWSTDK